MGIFERLRNIIVRRAQDEGTDPTVEQQDAFDLLLRGKVKQEYIDREKAMDIAAVSACVNRIADDIAALPIRLYQQTGDRVEEVKDDRRVYLLNEDTGDTLTGSDFKAALIRDYYMGKGGYVYINRVGLDVQSLHYVKESEVSFLYNVDPIFKSYSILIQGIRYDPWNFIKILRNTRDGRAGTPIQDEAQKVLSVAYGSLKFEENLVRTGGNKKGFLKTDGHVTQEVIDKIKAAWKRLYSNSDESVVVLNNGIDFQESSNTSVEMQLDESKASSTKQICQLFGMPPSILNGGATAEDRKSYVDECLYPLCERFAVALNRDLLKESEKGSFYFAFDLTERTKGDLLERYRAYEIASKNGFLQIDEIRTKENMPSMGLNFVRLGLQDVLYNPVDNSVFVPNTGDTKLLEDVEPELDEAKEPDDGPEPPEDAEHVENQQRATKKPKRRRGGDRR